MKREAQIDELMRVFMQFKRHMRHSLSSDSIDTLTITQIEIMRAIEAGVVTLRDIAKLARMTPSAATQQLKVLEAHDCVTRSVSEHDKREHIVRLTDKGSRHLKKRYDIVQQHLSEQLHEMSDDELQTFTSLMKKMIK